MEDLYISRGRQDNSYYNNQYQQYQPIPPQQQYDQNDGDDENNKKPKKKKKKRLRKFVAVILILIVLFNGGLVLLISSSGYTKSDYTDYRYISYADLNNDNRIVNILLIGTDDDSGGSARSDSMILLSLDYKNKKIKMTSFLRDCWVEIPSSGKSGKLNSAYAKGGAQLLCDTIEYNFRVDINHYIKVDFEMFTEIIDALGGIEVEVTEKEADFINRTTKQTISSGKKVHLNGEEALVYARIRKLDSDYMRTERQRKIISSIIKKATKTKFSDLIKMMKDVLPLIESDMSSVTITGMLYMGGVAALAFDIEQLQMPSDDMMTTGYVGSQWAELPDFDICRKELKKFIYE